MSLRGARRTCILLALADGRPRHADEILILQDDYTSVPRAVVRELLRELVRDGLVAETRCSRDGRRREYVRVPHPWETETSALGIEAADA